MYSKAQKHYDPLVCVWEVNSVATSKRQLYAIIHYIKKSYENYCDIIANTNKVIRTWWKKGTDVHIIVSTTGKKTTINVEDIALFETYKQQYRDTTTDITALSDMNTMNLIERAKCESQQQQDKLKDHTIDKLILLSKNDDHIKHRTFTGTPARYSLYDMMDTYLHVLRYTVDAKKATNSEDVTSVKHMFSYYEYTSNVVAKKYEVQKVQT
jgi:hypothetical protein